MLILLKIYKCKANVQETLNQNFAIMHLLMRKCNRRLTTINVNFPPIKNCDRFH